MGSGFRGGRRVPILALPVARRLGSAYRELAKTGAPAERITASGFGMELQLLDN